MLKACYYEVIIIIKINKCGDTYSREWYSGRVWNMLVKFSTLLITPAENTSPSIIENFNNMKTYYKVVNRTQYVDSSRVLYVVFYKITGQLLSRAADTLLIVSVEGQHETRAEINNSLIRPLEIFFDETVKSVKCRNVCGSGALTRTGMLNPMIRGWVWPLLATPSGFTYTPFSSVIINPSLPAFFFNFYTI